MSFCSARFHFIQSRITPISRLCVLFLLLVCSWQPAYANWLQETSGFRGGLLINLGSIALQGESHEAFNGVNGLHLSGSYMNALDKDAYESQIIYFEYGFGYTSFNGEDSENETCVIPQIGGSAQNCSITNSIQIIDLNASSLFFWHINEYSALFGRLGLGYSLTTIDQVATGDGGDQNTSSASASNISLITGVGVVVAKTVKLELLQYSVGGSVESARDREAQVEGAYGVTELRLSVIL